MTSTVQSSNSSDAARLALRVVGSAVFAFAMAYRNVAVAGPSDKTQPLATPVAAYSAPVSGDEPDEVVQQSLVVLVDHLSRVGFDDVVKTVLVGNPAIADVTMISKFEAVITAKTVGATNIFFLDPEGRALGDFEVVVREGEERRVVLRRGPGKTELFQCAPRCERTLSQIDSAESYTELSTVVAGENDFARNAAAAGGDQGGAPAP